MPMSERLRGLSTKQLEELKWEIEENLSTTKLVPGQVMATGQIGRNMTDRELLDHVFTYHDNAAKIPKYTAIRTAGRNFAETIMQNLDPCADRTVALRNIREAVFWANAGLAWDGKTL